MVPGMIARTRTLEEDHTRYGRSKLDLCRTSRGRFACQSLSWRRNRRGGLFLASAYRKARARQVDFCRALPMSASVGSHQLTRDTSHGPASSARLVVTSQADSPPPAVSVWVTCAGGRSGPRATLHLALQWNAHPSYSAESYRALALDAAKAGVSMSRLVAELLSLRCWNFRG